jgi:hypothetical protein
MLTVAELIKELQEFPADAKVYAYEGEIIGVVVVSGEGGCRQQLGYILTPTR